MTRPRYAVAVALLSIAILGAIACLYFEKYRDSGEPFRALSGFEAQQRMQTMIADRGPDAAWSFLKHTYIRDGVVRLGNADVHSLAHDIGQGFYAELGMAGLSHCDDTFTGGCFHGVIGEMVQTEGLSSMKGVSELCELLPSPASCAHGAGHGINESSAGSLTRALSECSWFVNGHANDCAEGVLMDASWGWKNSTMEKEPWKHCSDVPKSYRVPCASAIGNYFSEYRDDGSPRKYDPKTIATVCADAPHRDMMDICFMRLEQSIARRAAGGDGAIRDLCSHLPDDRIEECDRVATMFSTSDVP